MRSRFFVIVNSAAGKAKNTLLPQVLAALTREGAEVTIAYPSSGAAARQSARKACQSGLFDAVVAAGGDGTIREVAAGALGSDVPLGVVPIGTGNVLAQELGLSPTSREIARALLTGSVFCAQAGQANGEPFLLMAGVGFDGRVTATLNRQVQKRLGKLAYLAPVLKAVLHPLDELDVTIDGVPHKANWTIVANSRFYAGSFVVAPQASIFAEQLYAVVFHARSRLGLVRQLLALAAGRIGRRKDVAAFRCQRVKVTALHRIPTQIDGDPLGCTPLNVEVSTHTVRVIVAALGRPLTMQGTRCGV
jgi:YegS/Rv2252/BmrU family lipid kinase